jgi:hypothetical protein
MKFFALALFAGLGLARAEAQFHPRYKGGQLHVDIQRQRGEGSWESLHRGSKLCTGDRLRFELSAETQHWVRLYTQDRSQPGGAAFAPNYVPVGSTPVPFASAEPLEVGPSAPGDVLEHFAFLVANGRPDESHHCTAVAEVGGSCEAASSVGARYRLIEVFLRNLPAVDDAPEATQVGLMTIVLKHPETCR